MPNICGCLNRNTWYFAPLPIRRFLNVDEIKHFQILYYEALEQLMIIIIRTEIIKKSIHFVASFTCKYDVKVQETMIES